MAHQLAVSVWSLQRLSLTRGVALDDLLEIIANMGVGLVEVNEDYLRSPPYNTPAGYRRLRKRAEGLGIRIASIWFYTDLIGASMLTSPEAVAEQVLDGVATAVQLGCPRVTIPAGEGPADLSYQQGYDLLRAVLERVLPEAEEQGIDIGFEAGRSFGRFQTPEASLALISDLQAPNLRVVPDLEAWRHATPDLPLAHVESTETAEPSSLSTFVACLPHAPLIHAKLLRLDENGDEPHFPLADLMAAVRASGRDHILDIEFEGWIPDIDPDRDSIVETQRCVDLMRRLLGDDLMTLSAGAA